MAGHPQRRIDEQRLACITPPSASAIWDCIHSGLSIRNTAMELGYTYAALSDWLHDPARRDILNAARARAAGHLVEDTISIADNGADTSAPDPARDKLRIQARQWLASRWDRTTYGERSGPSVEVNVANMYLNAMRNVQPVDTAVVIDAVPPTAVDPEA